MEEESLFLPPGFRFHPTDEEIISEYLSKKVADRSFSAVAVGEADLNSCEPWDLPKKAKMGEKAWYFFFQKGRKYPTGKRTNRATGTGYWKATGKDKEIRRRGRGGGGALVGMKKTLVFYTGRAPRGEKTNWVMHEFRLESCLHDSDSLSQLAMESWVVCRVFHKNEGIKKTPITDPSGLMIPHPNPFSSHGGSATSGYSHREEEGSTGRAFYAPTGSAMPPPPPPPPAAFVGQCKAEPVSDSNPTASRSDLHREISSYIAGDSSSSDPLLGLENIWEF